MATDFNQPTGWFAKTVQNVVNPIGYALDKTGIAKKGTLVNNITNLGSGANWATLGDYWTNEPGHKINNLRDVAGAARHFFQTGLNDDMDETMWKYVAPGIIGAYNQGLGAAAGAFGGALSEAEHGEKNDATTGDFVGSMIEGASSGLMGSSIGKMLGVGKGASAGASAGAQGGGNVAARGSDVSGRALYSGNAYGGADPASLSWWDKAGMGIKAAGKSMAESMKEDPHMWTKMADQLGQGFWSRERGNPWAGVGTQMAESSMAAKQAKALEQQRAMSEEALVEQIMKLMEEEEEGGELEGGLGSTEDLSLSPTKTSSPRMKGRYSFFDAPTSRLSNYSFLGDEEVNFEL